MVNATGHFVEGFMHLDEPRHVFRFLRLQVGKSFEVANEVSKSFNVLFRGHALAFVGITKTTLNEVSQEGLSAGFRGGQFAQGQGHFPI